MLHFCKVCHIVYSSIVRHKKTQFKHFHFVPIIKSMVFQLKPGVLSQNLIYNILLFDSGPYESIQSSKDFNIKTVFAKGRVQLKIPHTEDTDSLDMCR